MITEIGEYIVGAYLKIIEECDLVDYNVHPPGGGREGQVELDVLGLNFKTNTAYLCEVTTHIQGLDYGNGNKGSLARIATKHQRQVAYAGKNLGNFESVRFQFWSPHVPKGFLTDGLSQIDSLESITNKEYTARVDALRQKARDLTHDVGNPFFRSLQILERLR